MKHAWTVLCRRTLIDDQTQSLSMIDTVELIEFETNEEVSALPIDLMLVSLWWRTEADQPENGKGRTQIIYSANDQSLINMEYDIDLTKAPRHRLLGKLQGIPFVGSGIYQIVVQVFDESVDAWQNVATVPLQIQRIPQ